MDEILEMENSQNPVEEETTVEEPQPEEVVTPKENDSPEQYSEREKRYYARMKQAENIAKAAREELSKVKRPASLSNIDAILEVQEATKDLSAVEIAELKLRADALKVPLTEARRNENYMLWQKAYKEKVEKENIPLPSTTQGNVKGEKTYKEMDLVERTKYFEELGLIAHQTNPRPSRQ
jgi:hypothetical protein